MAKGQAKSTNLKFRKKSPREFRALQRVKSFAKQNRNIPYTAYHFSKNQFNLAKQRLARMLQKGKK